MLSELLDRILSHVSSISIGTALTALYLSDHSGLIEPYLPVNGQPLAMATVVGFIALYELQLYYQKQHISWQKLHCERVADSDVRAEVQAFQSQVNMAVLRQELSGKDCISSEDTKKHIMELEDWRVKLGQNSYYQRRLESLVAQFKNG